MRICSFHGQFEKKMKNRSNSYFKSGQSSKSLSLSQTLGITHRRSLSHIRLLSYVSIKPRRFYPHSRYLYSPLSTLSLSVLLEWLMFTSFLSPKRIYLLSLPEPDVVSLQVRFAGGSHTLKIFFSKYLFGSF